MTDLPTIKIFKIDYSFLMKNYLNPELWKKEWTLFAYKNVECTLQIYSILTLEDKIRFLIKVYSHNIDSEERDNYCSSTIDCSLKLEDLAFLKRQINRAILNTIVLVERIYYIRTDEYYKDLERQRYSERNKLRDIAEDFLDDFGVTSDACREAYVDAYIDENEKMYDFMENWEDNQVYRRLTGMYLAFLNSLEDDPKKDIVTKEIQDKLTNEEYKNIVQEITEYTIFMEDEENFEKEMKSKLEEVY